MKTYGHGARLPQTYMSSSFKECSRNTFDYMFPKLVQESACVLEINQANHDKLHRLGEILGTKSGGAGNDNPNISAGYTYWGHPAGVEVRRYKEGTLTLDLFDTRTKELVWRGWSVSPVRPLGDPREEQAYINQVVEELLKHFPPY